MALTANQELGRFVDQELRSYPVLAAAHIYKGAFVGRDSVTGMVRPLVAGDAFEGIAYEEIDNTAGQDGDLSVRVYTLGDFKVALSGAAATDRGATVYASDDATATLTATANSAIGRMLALEGAGNIVLRLATA